MKISKSKIKQILSEEIEVFRNTKRSQSILKKLKESWNKEVETKIIDENSDKITK
jgi:hypothetical protein